MAGFTLYETLRIFVPGALAVLIVDIATRLALGPNPFAADGGASDFVQVLESAATFAIISLLVGLLLYLVDVPSRTRVFREGDPVHDYSLPSQTLRNHLVEELKPKAMSIYFLLSDRYLSDAMHRRVYFFGSMFRVFVDLRVLLSFGALFGLSVTVMSARNDQPFQPVQQWPGLAIAVFAAMCVGMFVVGSVGVFDHWRRFARRRRSEQVEDPSRAFGTELARELSEFRGIAMTISAFTWLGFSVLLWFPRTFLTLGLLSLVGAFAFWLWVEIGPPSDDLTLRSAVMRRLGVNTTSVQFTTAQRLFADASLLIPALAFGVGSALLLDWSPYQIVAWGILVFPCTAIMSLRKHELRILNIYREQSVWLDLNRSRIDSINQTGELPTSWD